MMERSNEGIGYRNRVTYDWTFKCDQCGRVMIGAQVNTTEDGAIRYLRNSGWTVSKGGFLKCLKCARPEKESGDL